MAGKEENQGKSKTGKGKSREGTAIPKSEEIRNKEAECVPEEIVSQDKQKATHNVQGFFYRT